LSQTENIEHALRELNNAFARGAISPEEYERQDALLRARQAEIKAFRSEQGWGVARSLGKLAPVVRVAAWSPPPAPSAPAAQLRLSLPRYKTSPEERERRRLQRSRTSRNGAIPHFVGGQLTLTEQAVLAVVGEEVRRKGFCALVYETIGSRAGCSRDAVRKTIRKARAIGLISIEERRRGWMSDANIIRVIDRAWSRWLLRKPYGGTSVPAPKTSSLEGRGFETVERPAAAQAAPERAAGRQGPSRAAAGRDS
jgi:hypothetical protein